MQAMLRLAEPLAARGDFPGLRQLMAGIQVEAERKAAGLIETSYAESLAGRYRNARTAALLALALAPRSPALVGQLAARLRTSNDGALLLQLIDAVGPPRNMSIPLLLALAAQLSHLNLQERALELLNEARRGDPDFPPALLARGQVLTYLGRLPEARLELERCVQLAPEIALAHWFLAHIGRATPDHNHVARLRNRLRSPKLPARETAALAFALHQELDGLQQYEDAWSALQRACLAKRSMLSYDRADSHELVEALIALPAGWPAATSNSTERTPIFIVGMHRSGTTLLEQLLDASPQVSGIGELYDFTSAMRYATNHHCRGVIDRTIVARAGAVDFAAVGRRYLDGVAWRLGAEPFFTDKLPSNFLNIGFICRSLPQARILHMVRDPVATCFSNLREMFSDANPYSYDQLELAEFFAGYQRLMAHWHRVCPGRILDVSYAALTGDTEAVVREVAAFCGLNYVPAMCDPRNSRRAVATASAVQVREGVTQHWVSKWVPYESHLQPLILTLQRLGALTDHAPD
ncbi:MAG: sulfotransferase family protein [Gammaproteobacteria bacterium]|nr:MAG: sulfotransferase family protein [Gammaproteobacteria bacterium]